MTLSTNLGVVEISTLWHFRLPLLIQMYIKVVSSPDNQDWNALPDSLISSAEDAEDCVAKFTSLLSGPIRWNILQLTAFQRLAHYRFGLWYFSFTSLNPEN